MATKKSEPAKKKAEVGDFVLFMTTSRPWSVVAGILEEITSLGGAVLVTVSEARMIAYFAAGSKTIFGVAANGVPSGSRVSPKVDSATYTAIEGILLVTPKARKSIEAEPWE